MATMVVVQGRTIFSTKHAGSHLLQNGFGLFFWKTVKTLHVDWPDSEKHRFLQNIWVHYKIRVCIPLILYKIHREKVICTGHMPPLFRRGNFKGDKIIMNIIHPTQISRPFLASVVPFPKKPPTLKIQYITELAVWLLLPSQKNTGATKADLFWGACVAC